MTCYAESKDGLRWTKPELGLFEFDGSKENNIVWDGRGDALLHAVPGRQPEGRARRPLQGPGTRGKGGLLALKSADGLRWQPMADQPVITKGAFDSQNLAFWDPHLGKYREYHRVFRGRPRHHDRHVGRLPDLDRAEVPRLPGRCRRSTSTPTRCCPIRARRTS